MKFLITIVIFIIVGCAEKSPVTPEARDGSTISGPSIIINNRTSQGDDYKEIKVTQYGRLIGYVMPGCNDTINVGVDRFKIYIHNCSVRMPSGCSTCGPRVTRSLVSVTDTAISEGLTLNY
jgi:hypothetical protein